MDTRLLELIPLIAHWAYSKQAIRRLWFYGSRVRGTQHPDSDLDVAIEIDHISTEAETQLHWMDEKAQWLAELQALSPFKVHLEMYGTPNVNAYLEDCSRLVYEREI